MKLWVDAEFVICKECIYQEDCPHKEDHDGCYFGETLVTQEEIKNERI